MDKSILKKFAIESRQDLMQKMRNKIKLFYVDEKFTQKQNGDIYVLSNEKNIISLSKEEYDKRELLLKRIEELGIEQVVEEAAYTWFNRIVAIRYMEINDYLPLTKENQSLGIRVLSSKDNTPDPEIIKFTNLMNPYLDINFQKEKFTELKDDNERFKYVLLLVCKKLGRVIPQVFDGITDYIDILIPDNLLNDTGFVNKIVKEIPESNFSQVEIIGWLYQYYITEKKENVFNNLKKNIKVKKNDIPAATQLFTPDWIVKYMVENSLGRYTHISSDLDFYIKDFNISINESKNIEQVKFIDPCCGSGHILVYAFEIIVKEYIKLGYSKEQAVENTITKNLYGIDIDLRAVQLSILSICLKAAQIDKKIFSKECIKNINIINIKNSNNLSRDIIICNVKNEENRETMDYLLADFKNADEYGSLLKVEKRDYNKLEEELKTTNFLNLPEVQELTKQAQILSQKYNVVCTNPPYMGRKSINEKLSNYLQINYSKTKSEMYSAFIERCNEMTEYNGYQAMITIHTWMFITSFENVRKMLLEKGTFINMLHTGPATFTDLASFNVLATAFCLKKAKIQDYESTFVRLTGYYNSQEKIDNLKTKENYYYINQNRFKEIPGMPFIYWISNNLRNAFKENPTLGEFYPPKQGLATADNERFVRNWFEVNISNICFDAKTNEEARKSHKKWFPYNKGGDYRKWYGNNEYVVNWENDGYEIKNFMDDKEKVRSRPQNLPYYFKKGITWSLFGFENFGVRYKDNGFIFDVSGSSMFPDENDIKYIIGYLCSNIAFKFLSLLAPTVNFQVGNISSLPFKNIENHEEINKLVDENINICKEDWDSNETSWDFKKPKIFDFNEKNLSERMEKYKEYYSNELREKLRQNEEKINYIFSNIYGINNDIDCKVNDRDLSLKEFNERSVIIKLISYAVGCMFGRYSLDEEGLVYAGDKFEEGRYKRFKADKDNIIPITDAAYFADDIVSNFKRFLEKAFGNEKLIENMNYIADILGKKGTETSEDTLMRYFVNDFYQDHIKMYQKRPIYWLFDSGKKNGFKALIYVHRYNENLIPKLRLDYLHKTQATYEGILAEIKYKLTAELSMVDKKELQKRKEDFSAKLNEIKEYDENIAHIANQRIKIYLDDGILRNYTKFADVLAKIK